MLWVPGARHRPRPRLLQNLDLASYAGLMWSRRSLGLVGGTCSAAALVRRSGTLGSWGLLSH
jgi:hypothetical protein